MTSRWRPASSGVRHDHEVLRPADADDVSALLADRLHVVDALPEIEREVTAKSTTMPVSVDPEGRTRRRVTPLTSLVPSKTRNSARMDAPGGAACASCCR